MLDYKIDEFYKFALECNTEYRMLQIDDEYNFFAYTLNSNTKEIMSRDSMDNIVYYFHDYTIDTFSTKIVFKKRERTEENIQTMHLHLYEKDCKDEFAFQALTVYDIPYSQSDLVLLLSVVDILRENEASNI